jgi:glycosyltransferase involved in cell wall biosynthesis
MKVAYITPGSGMTFYCQNCFRDTALLNSLTDYGHEVVKVPMYLPSGLEERETIEMTPVFYGAINVYLKEKLPFYRNAPAWMERLFDSSSLLKLAAKKTGSTRASGLEEMTLSMLHGEEGRQSSELDQLIKFLKNQIKPDVVHLSNALLLGLARRLKHDLKSRVICSLQDENEWVDLMSEDYQQRVWNLMAEKTVDVDLFVTASRYYSEKSQKQLRISSEKIEVIYGGIDFTGYETSPLPFDPPVIGYMCRMSEYFGFHLLVDAVLRIKENPRFERLKLFVTGGYSGDDRSFVVKQIKKVEDRGFADDIKIFEDFCRESRIEFLKSLTLLSVPVPVGEAFGAYQVEAVAAGVPVVQPNVGCYPEFVDVTGGGIIYEPNTSEELARAIVGLLDDPVRVKQMGGQGRKVVLEQFSMGRMAKSIAEIYDHVA